MESGQRRKQFPQLAAIGVGRDRAVSIGHLLERDIDGLRDGLRGDGDGPREAQSGCRFRRQPDRGNHRAGGDDFNVDGGFAPATNADLRDLVGK